MLALHRTGPGELANTSFPFAPVQVCGLAWNMLRVILLGVESYRERILYPVMQAIKQTPPFIFISRPKHGHFRPPVYSDPETFLGSFCLELWEGHRLSEVLAAFIYANCHQFGADWKDNCVGRIFQAGESAW